MEVSSGPCAAGFECECLWVLKNSVIGVTL